MARSATFLAVFLIMAAKTLAQAGCNPVDALEPLDTWQTVSGGYAADSSMTWSVMFDLGVDYEFKTGCGDGATADHNTVIEWLTPDCTVIMHDDDGCENGRSRLNFNSFFDGQVLKIKVRGYQGAGGTFTMAYRSIGGVPGQCNDCPSYDEQLSPSSLWQTTSGAYGSNGCKVYRVFVSAGLQYTFKTGCGDGATADNDTHLEIFGPDCASLAVDDNSCESGRSMLNWSAISPGAIYVKVKATDGSAGTFTLAYQRSGGNGSSCSGCPTYDYSITPGQYWTHASSSYLSTGCQIYRMVADSGYRYTFKTGCGDGAGADHDTYLELFDADCSTLATDDNGCENGTSIIDHLVASTGVRYLKVSGSGGAQGFYSLAYKKSGRCTSCPSFDMEITPSVAWQTAADHYEYYDGCWMYKVNVTAGRTYVFQTACGNGGSSDHASQLQLFDAACAPMTNGYPYDCGGYGARLHYLATATGSVYLKASGQDGAFGTDTLAYRDLGPSADDCSATLPIEVGTDPIALAGSLQDATSDNDFENGSPYFGSAVKWYGLDLQQPCSSFIVSYCGLAPPWGNTLDILTNGCPGDTAFIGSTSLMPCDDGNASYSFTGLAPGQYHLPLLYDPMNSLDGSYIITVQCSNIVIGIDEPMVSRSWSIHPNPGGNEFWLERASKIEAPTIVRIFDPLGRCVHSENVRSAHVRFSAEQLPRGIYSVRIENGKERASLPWIKE